MFIKLDEKYAFKTNKLNWIIAEYRKNKEGKLNWENIKYYSDIGMAVKGLVKLKILAIEASTFAEAIKGVEEVHKELIQSLSPEYKVTKVDV